MPDVAGFILAVGLLTKISSSGLQHDRYETAARAASSGAYIQSGMKLQVDRQLRDFERKYVPKYIGKYGSATVIILKTITDQRLTLMWSF